MGIRPWQTDLLKTNTEMFEFINFSVITIGVFTFLPQITGLGIQLICSAIILAVAAEIIYFIHINPDVGYGIMGIFIFLIFLFLLKGIFVKLRERFPKLKRFIS